LMFVVLVILCFGLGHDFEMKSIICYIHFV